MTSKTKLFIDIAERAFFTWLETFLGLLLAAGIFGGTPAGNVVGFLSTIQVAAVAAIPAALAVLKGGVSSFLGQRDTAAALPKDVT